VFLSGCCICFTHIRVFSKYFIYSRFMVHSSVSCCKCFMFESYVQRVMGEWPRHRRKGHGESRAGGWGARPPGILRTGCAHPHPSPNRSRCEEKEEGSGEGATDVGQGKIDKDRVHMRGGTRQTWKYYSNTVGVQHVSMSGRQPFA